ncbi:hypothetical protein Taro_034895 [Colocasia esculenta]|uniref:Uncharacterized protein n=1 Tax=Colocasia esculenta TaxID=4460 RepID=A0A843W8X3_COLES|nr:hypothetical protein [Colocasia esculenta]
MNSLSHYKKYKLIMTGVAALDRLGGRPLLIGGVSGIVISLFLLSSYYNILKGVPIVAVVGLLLYVGCYQELVGTGILFAGFGMIGKIVEYDNPSKLLETNSAISKLMAEYWSNCRRSSSQNLEEL